MQCQFCGFNNAEVGLREGRCNQCGSMLQWNDSSGDVTPEVQAAVANLAARIAPRDGAVPGAASEDLKAVAAALRNQHGGPNDRGGPGAGINGAASVDSAHVEGQWRPGLDTDAQPLHTLKGVSTTSVSDLPVFIHPRAIRRSGDPEFVPSEYELLDVIGEGGVGVVYSARQSSIDRNVAVKMIKASQESNQGTRDKFLAEAIVTGDLDHPNIVPVYDLGKDPSGALFYSMKRVAGTPWSAVLTKKSQAENLEILMKVADAIAFAHARGIVHRDIKPENVMLGEFGEVLVMDWGIALPLASYRKSGGVLLSQGLGGTPAYMAPEMATGPLSKISMASDVYLLGAVLYEIVSGHPPHRGADVMSCVLAAAKNDVAPTDKSGELLDIALRAMATNPEDRYSNVLEFQKAVRSYQSHMESVTLCERARTQLNDARRSESYDDYSRAVFAFEEAVTLWSGNDSARLGESEARRAFAECALDKGDYDLGLSQTNPNDLSHADVIERLQAALRERRARDLRFRLMRTLAQVMGFLTLVLSIGFAVWFYLSGERIKSLSVDNENKRKEAERLKGVAEDSAEDAERERISAVKAKTVAINALDDATQARQRAEVDQDRAEEEQFYAEEGVVNERIEGNAFDVAREVLDSHRSSNKARLRHWEWGRLEYLANGGRADQDVVRSVPIGGTLETLAVSSDEQFVVTAEDSGRVVVWRAATGERMVAFDAGHEVLAIGVDQKARIVVTCGERATRGANPGIVRVWQREGEGPGEFKNVDELTSLRDRVISVALSSDGRRLVAGGHRGEAFIWTWGASASRKALPGLMDAVGGVAFSQDGQRVATACDDKKVYIWDAATGVERQRFQGHRSQVYAVAFSHRGDRVASGDFDGRVLVWPRDESKSLAEQLARKVENSLKEKSAARAEDFAEPLPAGTWTCVGHSASVTTLAFSRDDRHLATGSQDNTVRLWTLPQRAADGATAGPNPIEAVLAAKLRGHGGWIRSVALWSPESSDAFTIISGARDRAWRRWNVTRYQEHKTLTGIEPVRRATYTPNGRTVIVTRDNGAVELWDTLTGTLAKKLEEGHSFMVSQAIVTPDGRELLTVAMDNTLRVWDLATGVEAPERKLDQVGRRGIAALSPDGRNVLTGGPNQTARWWDLRSGTVVHTLNSKTAERSTELPSPQFRPVSTPKRTPDFTSLAVSLDGQLLFTGDDAGECRLWDAKTGQTRSKWNRSQWGITAAAFVAEGTNRGGPGRLITASSDANVSVWDVTSDFSKPVIELRHLDPVWSFAVSPDGRRAVTSSNVVDEATKKKVSGLWYWDLTTGKSLGQLPLAKALADAGKRRPMSVNSLTWSAGESDTVLISLTDQTSSRQELWQWRAEKKSFEPAPLPASARGALWTALPISGGRQLVTAGGTGARLWDIATNRERMSFKPQKTVNDIDVSSDGRWLVVAGGDGANGVAKIWSLPENLQDARHVQTMLGQPGKDLTAAAFAPNHEEVVTGDKDGVLRRWRVADGKPSGEPEYPALTSTIYDLRFSPDGRWLVASADDGLVHMIDTKTREMHELAGHTGAVRAAAISSDSRWLITGADDRAAFLWDLTTRQRVAELWGHSGPVEAVGFSPDALRAITGSRDTTTKIWNLFPLARLAQPPEQPLELKDIATLPPHNREVKAAQFSPNGLDVLTASVDTETTIFFGEALPPAVELAPGGFKFVEGSRPLAIDAHAVVTNPTPQDGEQLTLSLAIDHAADGDTLAVAARETPYGSLAVVEGQLRWTAAGKEEAVELGVIEQPNEGVGLIVKFAANTPAAWVQETLRSITFANTRPTPATHERQIRCTLTRNTSAGAAPAEIRTVQVDTREQ